ncbi:hypothetical protein AGMMS49975_07740 [Clostridia bacterium]|nr:hypothetical protein AGMMS49975_07740 [Clostridia bacterium]
MLCERCNLKPATVHLHHIANGETSDMYLCSDCAAENKIGISPLLNGFLASFYNIEKAQNSVSSAVCVKCGTTYERFRKSGKVGCAHCYDTFRKELGHAIKNIHGSETHEGKFPSRASCERDHKEVAKLRVRLHEAVEKEDYELAAKLRDEIKIKKG